MPSGLSGSWSLTRIEEMLTPGFDPAFLFPDYDAEILREHDQLARPGFWHPATGKVMSSMHSWMLRNDRHVILIDTGCGNGKERARPLFERFHMLDKPYLDRLAAAGVRPEDVTLVICTHLHIDHVGWNTRLQDGRWVPTFPNARYLFGRREFAHWSEGGAGLAALPENGPVIEDSVRPVVEAGLAELVDDETEGLPGISVQAAPGHTEGQLAVIVRDGRRRYLFSGDSLHQPMQVYRPHWNSRFCEDAARARETRRGLLEFCVEEEALLLPAHFGAPHGGFVRRSGADYRFEPCEDAARAA